MSNTAKIFIRFNGGKTLFPEAVEWPTEAVCLNFYLIDKAVFFIPKYLWDLFDLDFVFNEKKIISLNNVVKYLKRIKVLSAISAQKIRHASKPKRL